jgi:hypothetical protein
MLRVSLLSIYNTKKATKASSGILILTRYFKPTANVSYGVFGRSNTMFLGEKELLLLPELTSGF